MIPIDEDAICRALVQDNPWWANKTWSPLETKHERSYLKPFCEQALNLKIRRSTVLMGPRRVGKTVMLKQLIYHALKKKPSAFVAKRIFFTSLDTPLYSDMSLDQLISLFEETVGCKPNDKRLIIFDEIQYLKDWERHLKVLTDKYPNTKFIVSGSAAAALRLKSNESGAGRFTDFLLPPLTFIEYLMFTSEKTKLSWDSDPFDELLKKNLALKGISDLNKMFIDYLNYGGYPEAVLNPDVRNNPQQFIGRDIIDKVLLRDLPSLYGIQNPQELNRLLTAIAWNTGQEMSLENLSQNANIAKQTISRYLEYLEAAMLIRRVRRIDGSAKTLKRERQFKLYLTSPSLRAALFGPVSEDDTDQLGHLVETALFAQLFHSVFAKNLYYARWKSGRTVREVDMIIAAELRKTPVIALEIKWSDRVSKNPEELIGLVEFS